MTGIWPLTISETVTGPIECFRVAKRETQRRAAMAILAFVLVMVTFGAALYAFIA